MHRLSSSFHIAKKPRLFTTFGYLVLVACFVVFVVKTLHWTLISDAVLMHYVGFLMGRGLAPYGQIADVNLPGAYLLDGVVVRVFNAGALGFRLYDLTLLAVGSVCIVAIARPYSRFAGVLAAALFVLLHGADGVAQEGQRDFAVAVLLLVGVASLLVLERRPPRDNHSLQAALLWGMWSGAAATIKPHFFIAGALVLVVLLMERRRHGGQCFRTAVAGLAGLALPLLLALLFLIRHHAVGAFFHRTLPLIVDHASLGRHSLWFLLGHAVPAKILPLVFVAGFGAYSTKIWRRFDAVVMMICAGTGFASFVLQGKGYGYHRSVLVAFLLCLCCVQLAAMLGSAYRTLRVASALVLGYAVLWLAPASVARAVRWKLEEPTLRRLQQDLGPYRSVDAAQGGVQCMDTMAGCITALSRLGIAQSTGFLYDCYFFAPEATPTRARERALFLEAIRQRPPLVFVVTDQWCFNLPQGYAKLEQWPAFRDLLAQNYTLAGEEKPAPIASKDLAAAPFGYRIYRRR